MSLRATALAAALAALVLAPAAPAGAQGRYDARDYEEALADLGRDIANFFSRRRAQLEDGAAITLSEMSDRDLGIACNPLAEESRGRVETFLTRELREMGLRLRPDALEDQRAGNYFVVLEYAGDAERVAYSAAIRQYTGTSTGARDDDRFERDAPAATLDARQRGCLVKDPRSYTGIFCTSDRPVSLLDTLDAFGRPLATADPGTELRALASFDGERALLMSFRRRDDFGGAADPRGFLSGSLASLIERGLLACDGLVTERRSSTPEVTFAPLTPVAECPDGCPTLVRLPAGTVRIGSHAHEAGRERDEAELARAVAMPLPAEIAIGTGEITQGEWQACVNDRVCRPRGAGDPNLPVAVSYNDAVAYAGWLSEKTGATYRLPTEAEWEYAARAIRDPWRQPTRYHWGAVMRPDLAVCRNCRRQAAPPRGPEPAGRRPANAFGLYHMHGNLWEWVSDCRDRGAATCPARMLKGGSFRENAVALRAGNRHYGAPDAIDPSVGFRVVREIERN